MNLDNDLYNGRFSIEYIVLSPAYGLNINSSDAGLKKAKLETEASPKDSDRIAKENCTERLNK